MTETIILDLDGPILDSQMRHYRCYADVLAEHGFFPISMERYWEMKRNRVSRHIQLAASGAEALDDEFLAMWMQRIEQKDYLALDVFQPGSFDTLCRWSAWKIRLILVTMRHNTENLEWQLSKMNILSLFEHILIVGNGATGKAKAEWVLSRVKDIQPANTLWIGDTEIDVEAARYVGIKSCALSCGLRTASFLESLDPHYLETDLISLASKLWPGPDSHPGEFLKRLRKA